MKRAHFVYSVLVGLGLALLLFGTSNGARPEPLRASAIQITPTPAPCESHDESLRVRASESQIQVGETVTISVRLKNKGCAGLGLPQYSLFLTSNNGAAVLRPAKPKSVTHYLGLGTGDSDKAEFVLRGVRRGQVDIHASVTFEVSLGPHGPYYWSGAGSNHIVVKVKP